MRALALDGVITFAPVDAIEMPYRELTISPGTRFDVVPHDASIDVLLVDAGNDAIASGTLPVRVETNGVKAHGRLTCLVMKTGAIQAALYAWPSATVRTRIEISSVVFVSAGCTVTLDFELANGYIVRLV